MTTTSPMFKNILRAFMLFAVAANAQGALTELANTPLVVSSSSTVPVQPNVFLMMDDSGSMGWDYMPDDVNSFKGNYGYTSSQCNGVYYDPNITYKPPVDSTGTSYADSSFTAAWKDGYNTASGTVDLSASFSSGGTTAGPAFYYKYSGAQTTLAQKNYYNTGSTFYQECNSVIGSTPGSSVFTKVTVSATSGPGSADERTNFANWYSYYRTRILMMKTATGLAFSPICPVTNPATPCNYRVGMATMNNNGGSKFINLATFDATQKANWYSMLYSTSANNSTPLLGALTRAGQMYAHKLPSNTLNGVTAQDPMQYSCQQNFTILSTDGFWNDATNSTLTGTSVGQQDGTEIRPMYDGASQTIQTSTPVTTVVQKQTVQNTTATTPWTRTVTSIGAACSIPAVTPRNTVSAYLNNNNRKMALGLSATNPDTNNPSYCSNLAANAWLCRGDVDNRGNATNPVVSSSPVTDSAGTTWYLVDSMSGNSNCVTNRSIWGNNYSSSKGACPGTAAVTGQNVTTQNQTYNQLVTGSTTSVDNYTTTVTTTVVSVNGQNQPATTQTVGPTKTNVSNSTAVTSDNGAPTGGTTWTNSGGSTTTCMANPPAAGASTPVAGSITTTNNGAATVTTLSTTTTTGAPTVSTSSSGGTSNTLADVAEYYYVNDLRTSTLGNCTGAGGNTLCSATNPDPYNNVPASGLDSASWQHMTTFTLGLGARGRMVFSPTYLTDLTGDFFSVKNGVTANSASGTCSWQGNGTTCNWPVPNVSGTPENIDDLWHAAVNGRGTYFSATNPATLATAISSALAGVSARTGASAAATTSNPNVTSGDNFVFSSTFITNDWYGELIRQQLDLTTGVTLSTIDWAAQALLDGNATRTIYTFSSTATNGLQAFTAANFGTNANFTGNNISSLSQFCTGTVNCLPVWQANHPYIAGDEYRVITAGTTVWYHVNTAYTSGAAFGGTDTTNSSVVTGAAGANLVNYLRGDRTNEGGLADTTKYFRLRKHILGDIVNAEAVYVKGSQQNYADFGYGSFVTANASRQGMVYAAANDGMLHAFYSASDMMDSTTGNIVATGGVNVTGGAEAWAYIPSLVLPSLYRLADKNYSTNHHYYVDGTPIQGEICVSNCNATSAVWKTILVGGLNGGGRGYYAMDVTNPAQPKALWEFTDTNMGNTYGNPEIAKLKDGTWVVVVTSGYNNVSPGDGQGHLYVLNAYTGALIRDITTGVGSVTAPSGLSRIIAQVVNNTTDSTILQVYGGDLLGNLWRFDVNGDVGAAGYDAQLLATLTGPSGVAQSITAKPQVGIVSGNTVVYVGTGRYLGGGDLTDTTQTSPNSQSIYGIKDPLTPGTTPSAAIYTTMRGTNSGFVQQTQTNTTCPPSSPATICTAGQIVRTSSHNAVNFATDNGWYVDLPDSGERATTDPTLKLGTLGFTTIVPKVDSCTVGGVSYSYFFDYRTGAPVSSSTTGVVAVRLGNALATRPVYVRLPNNTVVQLIRLSDGTTLTTNVPIGSGASGTRRVSWRTLNAQ